MKSLPSPKMTPRQQRRALILGMQNNRRKLQELEQALKQDRKLLQSMERKIYRLMTALK